MDLAREIRRAVDRFVDDDAADADALVEALDALPRTELAAMARVAFDRLEPMQQWSVLERLLGEGGVVEALHEAQRGRLSTLRRSAATAALLVDVVDGDRLDIAALPAGTKLTLGLFRQSDVDAARGRGRVSDVCARRLELAAVEEPGRFKVLGDEFNPRGGLFVSGDYDGDVWANERLDEHSVVAVGSASRAVGGVGDGDVLEHVAVRGSRLDVERDGTVERGRLHLGWATVDDVDAFPP